MSHLLNQLNVMLAKHRLLNSAIFNSTFKVSAAQALSYSNQHGTLQNETGNGNTKTKTSKTISFKDKIEQHDLTAKISNIRKWLMKGHVVKASITNFSGDAKKLDHLYDELVKSLSKEGKFGVKQINNKETRFTIEPKVQDVDSPPNVPKA